MPKLNLTIKQKMLLLVGLMLFGFIIVGIVYGYGISVQKTAKLEDNRVNALIKESTNIDVGILEARKHEKDFLLRKDLKYLDKHKATIKDLYLTINNLNKLLNNPKHIKIMENILSATKNYEESFNAMAKYNIELGLDETSGALGKLRNIVHELEADFKLNKVSDTLKASLLMMRRHEKDYLARKTDKYIKKMDEEKITLISLINKSTLSPEVKAETSDDILIYNKIFLEMTEATKKVNETIEILRTAAHEVEPLLHELLKEGEILLTTNAEFQEKKQAQVITIFVIVILVIAIIVVLIMFLISNNIT
ncbi:hypothetical protein ACFL2A_06255, partial [Thermodesulfobacteriota bacterium]